MNEQDLGGCGTATLIDDDPTLATAVQFALRAIDVHTDVYTSAEEFLEAIDEPPQGCLLVDMAMGELSGLDLLRTIRKRGWTTPAIVVSGAVTVPEAMDAVEYGVVDIVQKPLRARRLQEVVEKALALGQPKVSRGVLRQRFETLSEKEKNVLAFMLEGRMNKSIALRMDIGLRSVVRHKQSVLDKLGFKEPAGMIREWTRLEMDTPTIDSGDAIATLPQRVREEIRLNINDVATRLKSISGRESSGAAIASIVDDLNSLTESKGLLSPGEASGQPRERPYVALLSDNKQESILLAKILRLHQFFPDVCESARDIRESLSCAESDELPTFILLNGPMSVQVLSDVLQGRSLLAARRLAVLTINDTLPADSAVHGDRIWHRHLTSPFHPQDVVDLVLERVDTFRRSC